MKQTKLRAVFMRGGTSKALVFRREDLPEEKSLWAPIFLAAIGSPDPYGRQLDGLGGGISSLSKVCIVGPPSRPDADVDYTFAQISVRDASVDYSGNCGNMSSAIGPFAVDEGMVRASADRAVVRIHNTNTGKLIVSTFPLDGGAAAVDGDFVLSGVAGSGAPIALDFLDPGGSRTGRLLPTGNSRDVLDIAGVGALEVSMIDAANPCVFVAAGTIGMTCTELPEEIEANRRLLEILEAIRTAASVRMGIASDTVEAARVPGVPKVAAVASPKAARTLAGSMLGETDADVAIRMISIGQPHRAVPLTGALCLAVASRIEGTVVNRIAPRLASDDTTRIGHPSGVTVVSANVRKSETGWIAESASVYRTARRLMEGYVLVPASAPARR